MKRQVCLPNFTTPERFVNVGMFELFGSPSPELVAESARLSQWLDQFIDNELVENILAMTNREPDLSNGLTGLAGLEGFHLLRLLKARIDVLKGETSKQ